MSTNTLVVITGPTGVGKSDTAVWLARELNAEIISADSRQLYRDIPIGTAAPTAEQMAEVKHHLSARSAWRNITVPPSLRTT